MDSHLDAGTLSDYAEGLLPAPARAAADAHLAACARCRRERDAALAYFRELSDLAPVRAPADFLPKLYARLPRPTPPWKRAWSAILESLREVPMPVAAGLLLGVTAITVYMLQGGAGADREARPVSSESPALVSDVPRSAADEEARSRRMSRLPAKAEAPAPPPAEAPQSGDASASAPSPKEAVPVVPRQALRAARPPAGAPAAPSKPLSKLMESSQSLSTVSGRSKAPPGVASRPAVKAEAPAPPALSDSRASKKAKERGEEGYASPGPGAASSREPRGSFDALPSAGRGEKAGGDSPASEAPAVMAETEPESESKSGKDWEMSSLEAEGVKETAHAEEPEYTLRLRASADTAALAAGLRAMGIEPVPEKSASALERRFRLDFAPSLAARLESYLQSKWEAARSPKNAPARGRARLRVILPRP